MEAAVEISAAVKNVPALRFPEFEGEWVKKVFNDIVKVIDCKHRTPPYVDEGIAVVSPGSIDWGEIDLITPKKRVTEDEYESLMDHCGPDVGDMVFSRNQSIGIASIIYKKEKFVLGQDTVLIQAKKADPFFIYFRIQTHPIQSLISRLSGGSTFSRINLKDVRELKMYVSNSKIEQHKIGSFFTSVDDKIQQLSKKKALLEKYKKGVMQQLFSQQIRFKDDNGNDFPDWEDKMIKDIAPLQRGFDLPVIDIKDGEYPVVFSNGILKSHSEYKAKGPGVVTGRSGTIGQVTFVEKDYWPHNTSLWVTNFCGNDPKYVFYFYQQFKLERFGTGSGVPTLNRNDVHVQKVYFPTYTEQVKIRDFITVLDNKINHTSTQLEQAKQFKKGLLQQLFV
jgi:type I restriction enzyme, S subunit